VGLGLGVVVAGSLHDLGITDIAIPGLNLFYYAIAAGVFGVLAAIIPTIRAARVDILTLARARGTIRLSAVV
jgi:putative ABC transport system permease protein